MEANAATAAGAAQAARGLGLVFVALSTIGPMGIALGIVSYGALIYRSRALPQWIGWTGVVGGIVVPFGWLTYLQRDLLFIMVIGLVIGLVFALAMGITLIARGTQEPAAEQA